MHALRTLWTDKPFWRKLWTLAVPIIIQNFINSSLNMVDTLMIGAVGEDAVAAVGIANQVFYLYNLLLTGVAAGSAVLIAQYWGARQSDNICRCTGFALLGAGALGLVFTLLVTLFPHGLLQLFSRDEAVLSLGVTYIRCLLYTSGGGDDVPQRVRVAVLHHLGHARGAGGEVQQQDIVIVGVLIIRRALVHGGVTGCLLQRAPARARAARDDGDVYKRQAQDGAAHRLDALHIVQRHPLSVALDHAAPAIVEPKYLDVLHDALLHYAPDDSVQPRTVSTAG